MTIPTLHLMIRHWCAGPLLFQMEPWSAVKDIAGNTVWVPYDNLVTEFFWDVAKDVDKVDRTAQALSTDASTLAEHPQQALDLGASSP